MLVSFCRQEFELTGLSRFRVYSFLCLESPYPSNNFLAVSVAVVLATAHARTDCMW